MMKFNKGNSASTKNQNAEKVMNALNKFGSR